MSGPPSALRVLLIAEEGAGLAALQVLSKAPGCHVAAVMTTPPPPDAALSPSVWSLAHKLGCPTLPAGAFHFEEPIDLLVNVHSRRRIPDVLLARPRLGAFNLHPGPLPRYAGLNAPSWAIYRGETTHGVTLHHMTSRIDAGPIAYQTLFSIAPDDTGYSLSYRCTREGLRLLAQLLHDAASESARIPAIPQDPALYEYLDGRVPNDGRLDWTRPAGDVLNFIRAACYDPFPSPWGHPRTRLADREIGIVRTSATDHPATSAPPGTVLASAEASATRAVACGDSRAILIHRLHTADTYLNAADILTPGDRLT